MYRYVPHRYIYHIDMLHIYTYIYIYIIYKISLKVYLFYLLQKNKCLFFLLILRNNKDVHDLDFPLSAIIYGLDFSIKDLKE